MSAIVGIYNRTGQPVDPSCLKGMTDILAHRGPDGVGGWTSGPVGLGHRMLWTTPESLHEMLPFADDTAGVTITADARIDNRDELLPLLGLPDGPTASVSDSQVILAAYQKWGEDCPNHLLGDFAFAIWDEAAQKLFCARDHFGIKPFYYYSSDEMFAFATEKKALFSLSDVPRRLSEKRLADYLASFVEETTTTFYEDLLRLPPAHTLTVTDLGSKQSRYWTLDSSRQVTYATNEEYAAKFRELFVEAVRCRLRSTFPVGSLLSGGLDSSAITCVAATLGKAQNRQPLETFSAVFDEIKSCDEREYINAVLDHQEGLHPSFLQADAVNPLMDLKRILWHKDAPHIGANLSMIWSLYEMAEHRDVRVLLDGHDGDSTVSHGFGRLRELAYSGHWGTLMREAAGVSRIDSLPPWVVIRSYVRECWLMPAVESNKLLGFVYRSVRQVSRRLRRLPAISVPRFGWRQLLTEEFMSRCCLRERFLKAHNRGSHTARTEREEHYRTLTYAGQALALEELDALCGAHRMEPRFPFWDKRLVEFCLALPADQKLCDGWSRVIMRRAMEGLLPKKVQWRLTKTSFLIGFCLRLEKCNAKLLQSLVDCGPAAAIARLIHQNVLSMMHALIKCPPPDLTGPQVLPLWNVTVANAWLEQTELCLSLSDEEPKRTKGGE